MPSDTALRHLFVSLSIRCNKFFAAHLVDSNIQQAHSWDRLSVSSATFKKIVERYEVFPYFLQAVQGFELRDRSDTSTWNNFHLREGHSATEACYTLHYVEHNGRTRGDPWSFRKTAVYHRSDVQTQSSTWILVKLPSPLKGRLVDRLKKLWQETELCHARNLMVHILILAYSLQGWREYLDSLKLKMEDLVRPSYLHVFGKWLAHMFTGREVSVFES